ncbi:hypothetical protein IMU90_003864 [Salmonella enterica]|nr:hypothetical protein [Salmonella enterica]EGL6537371.1 hypothetical protein [Salmonella enterica]EJL9750716.1 hypothetical protein [Salmonella enterica]
MARLSSVFRSANVIRKERALTNDELMRCVPSVFSGEKHESRSCSGSQSKSLRLAISAYFGSH